jgi:hypothetical protein
VSGCVNVVYNIVVLQCKDIFKEKVGVHFVLINLEIFF